jgi:hypothetical protein
MEGMTADQDRGFTGEGFTARADAGRNVCKVNKANRAGVLNDWESATGTGKGHKSDRCGLFMLFIDLWQGVMLCMRLVIHHLHSPLNTGVGLNDSRQKHRGKNRDSSETSVEQVLLWSNR